jgi:hypothetical protein
MDAQRLLNMGLGTALCILILVSTSCWVAADEIPLNFELQLFKGTTLPASVRYALNDTNPVDMKMETSALPLEVKLETGREITLDVMAKWTNENSEDTYSYRLLPGYTWPVVVPLNDQALYSGLESAKYEGLAAQTDNICSQKKTSKYQIQLQYMRCKAIYEAFKKNEMGGYTKAQVALKTAFDNYHKTASDELIALARDNNLEDYVLDADQGAISGDPVLVASFKSANVQIGYYTAMVADISKARLQVPTKSLKNAVRSAEKSVVPPSPMALQLMLLKAQALQLRFDADPYKDSQGKVGWVNSDEFNLIIKKIDNLIDTNTSPQTN